eukprot:GHVN01054045.1.p1 GENE.GHVN01054045.1~~GHVN01054045.1.p1  ORF type:complete len:178 (+),score=33.66 GHVN01054045.1:625-1158(+)
MAVTMANGEVSTVVVEPGLVSFKKSQMKCLITDKPTNNNLDAYIEKMREHCVADLVYTCEIEYSTKRIEEAGITCHDLAFPDGQPPPPQIIDSWLQVIMKAKERNTAVAVHCVAGLGRAPVLAAIALIEVDGVGASEAIGYIRQKRSGAINRQQVEYLAKYKRRGTKGGGSSCCTVQ